MPEPTTRKGMSAAERKKDIQIKKYRKRPTGAGNRVIPAKDRGTSFSGSRYAEPTSVAVERSVPKPKKAGTKKMETEEPSGSPMKKYGAPTPMKKYGSPMKKNASPFAKLGSKEVDSPSTFKGDAASAIKKYIGKQ